MPVAVFATAPSFCWSSGFSLRLFPESTLTPAGSLKAELQRSRSRRVGGIHFILHRVRLLVRLQSVISRCNPPKIGRPQGITLQIRRALGAETPRRQRKCARKTRDPGNLCRFARRFAGPARKFGDFLPNRIDPPAGMKYHSALNRVSQDQSLTLRAFPTGQPLGRSHSTTQRRRTARPTGGWHASRRPGVRFDGGDC